MWNLNWFQINIMIAASNLKWFQIAFSRFNAISDPKGAWRVIWGPEWNPVISLQGSSQKGLTFRGLTKGFDGHFHDLLHTLQICSCSDQRDWESPVRVGKYLLPSLPVFFSASHSQRYRRQFKAAVIRQRSTLPQHPVKVNSVTLWSVLDELAARGAYRGWYTGCIQTIQAVCNIYMEAAIQPADIYPGSPLHSRAGAGCKDVVAGFPMIHRSTDRQSWWCDSLLSISLPLFPGALVCAWEPVCPTQQTPQNFPLPDPQSDPRCKIWASSGLC